MNIPECNLFTVLSVSLCADIIECNLFTVLSVSLCADVIECNVVIVLSVSLCADVIEYNVVIVLSGFTCVSKTLMLLKSQSVILICRCVEMNCVLISSPFQSQFHSKRPQLPKIHRHLRLTLIHLTVLMTQVFYGIINYSGYHLKLPPAVRNG